MKEAMTYPAPENPIKVHCTVDRTRLVQNDAGVFCTKCQRQLHDASRADAAPAGPETACAFFRIARLTAVATVLVTTACEEKKEVFVGGVPAPPPADAEHVWPPRDFVGLPLPPTPHAETVENAGEKLGQYPTAERGPAQFTVISPYTKREVDVYGIPIGSLVNDPDFPPEARKYFRIVARP
jgi:hypothetical protein